MIIYSAVIAVEQNTVFFSTNYKHIYIEWPSVQIAGKTLFGYPGC